MNRNYELVVILDPELKGKEQEELLEKIKKQITFASGEIEEVKEWGKKELAYPVSKKNAGIFYVVNFSAPTQGITSLKQKLQLEGNVLRFLLVVQEEKGLKKATVKK
ncbi:MAG: 30S ribosomal protein S6 [Patescibacteria group bacterium]|jgi:small subunit ribosomal protein S6